MATTDEDDVLTLAKFVLGRTYAFPSVQWWEAEEAAKRVLERSGIALPEKRTGLQ